MYRIERVSKEGLKDIAIIYKAVSNKNISIEELEKKFETQIFGGSYIGYIAYYENDEPAGYYGVFPIIIYKGNEKILTAQSGDTMTHPKHQGKGLFTKLATMTYELAKNEGIKLVWGFPNKNSYPGFTKKLNWIENEVLVKCVVKIPTIPLAKSVKKIEFKWLDRIYFSLCKIVFNPTIERFLKLNEGGAPFVLKDKSFFEYKNYIENRMVLGNHKNLLWIKLDGSMMIGDLTYSTIDELQLLFKKIKLKCMLLGITEIIFICNSNNPNLDVFKKLQSVKFKDSLPYCHLEGWDDELAKSMSICLADFDTF